MRCSAGCSVQPVPQAPIPLHRRSSLPFWDDVSSGKSPSPRVSSVFSFHSLCHRGVCGSHSWVPALLMVPRSLDFLVCLCRTLLKQEPFTLHVALAPGLPGAGHAVLPGCAFPGWMEVWAPGAATPAQTLCGEPCTGSSSCGGGSRGWGAGVGLETRPGASENTASPSPAQESSRGRDRPPPGLSDEPRVLWCGLSWPRPQLAPPSSGGLTCGQQSRKTTLLPRSPRPRRVG